jgi:hypothetical protein
MAPVIMVSGMAAAAWGQYILLSEREFALRGAILMAGGGLAFLAALLMGWQPLDAAGSLDEEGEEPTATSLPWNLRQTAGLLLGIVGGLAGFFLNDYDSLGESSLTAWGFFPWVAGVAGIVLAFWPRSERLGVRVPKLEPSSTWILVALASTLGLAAFFRFYGLDGLLKEMVGDHASVIFDVKRVTDGTHPVYFTAGQGREALFFYAGASLTPFFGHSFLTIKVVSAIAGVLTVAATYFMARELLGSRRVALIAAILISLSSLHVIISRVGFPVALYPLTTALTFAFLFRALKYNRSSDFVFAGLFLGLGLYTYSGARVVPLAVGLILVLSLLSQLVNRRGGAPAFLANSTLLVVAALIVYAPLARYALEQPDLYWSRVETVRAQDESLGFLANSAKKALLAFNWEAGIPGGQNEPHSSQLDYLTGAAFALGVGAMALSSLMRRRGLNAYAGLAFLIMLVPATGSQWDGTSFLRMAGAIPLVFAVAALPLHMGSVLLTKAFGRAGLLLALSLLGVTLGAIGFLNHHIYFGDYADFWALNSGNTTEYAAIFRDFADEGGGDLDNAYLKAMPYGIDTGVLAIAMGDLDWRNGFADIQEASIHALSPEAKLYVVTLGDEPSLRRLQEIYPQGSTYKFESSRSQPGRDFGFFVFLVPAKGQGAVTPLPNTHLVR